MKWFRMLGVFFFGGVLIGLHLLGVLRPIEGAIGAGIGSVGSVLYEMRLGLASYADSFRGNDYSERVRLGDEVVRLAKENADLKLAKTENETLKKLLHFSEITPSSSVVARVIGESADDATQSLILDKGSADGVKENRAVVTNDGILVGKTFAVEGHTSHVLLLTDNQSKAIATILALKNATGIVRGEFQIGLTMDLIPITEKIQKNDIVITAGREHGIPAGLLVGTISEIKTRPTDFYQTIAIRPFLDTSNLRIVSILTD